MPITPVFRQVTDLADGGNVRALAAQVLAPLLRQRGSLGSHLPPALQRCPERDRPLLQQLCFGTLRELFRLQAITAVLLKKPFQERDYELQALLLIGLWQLRHSRIPAHAALHETVAATAALDHPWARKLINALLRRYQREAEQLEATLANQPQFRWNHPQWMISKLEHNWPRQWQQILRANDQKAPMTLRVNERRLTLESAQQMLLQAGLASTPGQLSGSALVLEQPVEVDRIPGFEQGLFSVQDEAAQLAAGLLAAGAGERVLDACAAPGGKLCHLLERVPGLEEVVAVELEPSRIQRMADNLARLRLEPNYRLICADATRSDWWDGRSFDRILVDAPCSGSGVIRRHPDIKLLRRGEDINALARVQLEILGNLWPMLSPGGRLVYATCSVFSQENERIIERFVKQQPDARHLPIEANWGEARPFGRQLFPPPSGPDGFYYAILTKAKGPRSS
jgi:16S rRNA (cytosine967-C5)-methyltransferase